MYKVCVIPIIQGFKVKSAAKTVRWRHLWSKWKDSNPIHSITLVHDCILMFTAIPR